MSSKRWPQALLAVAVGALLVGVPPAPMRASTTYTWTDKLGTHAWASAGNWDPEGTPEDGDSIDIPANMGNVDNVPSVSLEQVTLARGDSLQIGDHLVTAKILDWNGGYIDGNMSVSQVATISDPSDAPTQLSSGISANPVTLTLTGTTVLTGTLELNGDVTIDNFGTFTNLLANIDGKVCCVHPSVFDNEGTLIGGTLGNMRYTGEVGAIAQGSILLDGGSHILKSGTLIGGGSTLDIDGAALQVNGTLKLGSGAKLIQGGPLPGDHTDVTGTFTLQGPVSGAAASWEWQGGTTYASMTLGQKAGLALKTTAFKQLNGASGSLGIGLLKVPPGATVTQSTSSFNLAGTVQNRGTWLVPSGQAATITGNGVSRPFQDFGLLDVTAASLTVTNARLDLSRDSNLAAAGVLKGGQVLLSDGELHLADGAAIDGASAVVKLDGGIEVSGGGTLQLRNGAEVDGRNASVLTGFTVGGSGRWDFGSGYLSANMIFGTGVTFRIYQPSSAPIAKHMQTQGGQGIVVDSKGTTLQSGDPVQVVPGTRIVNEGDWHILHGGFSSSSSGAQFVNQKALTVDVGGPDMASLSNMKLVQQGTFLVAVGSTFAVGSGSQQVAGTTTVKGRLSTGVNYRISGGTLTGGGTIDGNVLNEAVVAPGNGIGKLTITHGYTQVASGDLRIDLKNSVFDQLIVGGPVVLAGHLHLVLNQSGALTGTARTLLTATTLTGTPTVVFGALPKSKWKITVTSTALKLLPR